MHLRQQDHPGIFGEETRAFLPGGLNVELVKVEGNSLIPAVEFQAHGGRVKEHDIVQGHHVLLVVTRQR